MARPLRVEHPGAIWHVTSRGNERRNIFRINRDRVDFLDLLAETVRLSRWILHAYVLMSNHYHLLVETPLPTLSRGVKSLNEEYAELFNRRHRRVGHLVQGRFKSILVERETHLLQLVRYVVLNPVRCGAVRHADEYRWSNYRATAGFAPAPEWLETEWTRRQLAPKASDREAVAAYRRFIGDARGAAYRPWELLVGQVYLGSDEFCARMQTLVDAKPRSREHPKAQRRFVRPSFDAVIAAVLQEFGETIQSIRERSHRPARKALAHLATEESGVTFAGIGEWMNLTGAAVSHLVKRSREMEVSDRTYAGRMASIRNGLTRASQESKR